MDSVLWLAPTFVLLGACTRGLFGFGDSLVAVPLLMLIVEPTTAVVVIALMALSQGVLMIAREWRDIDWSASRSLLFAAMVGVPLGMLALKSLPVVWVKRALGAMLMAYATRSLIGAKLPELRSGRAAAVAGFTAGALGAAYHLPGPPVILYSAMARWDAAKTRATLQSFFTPLSVVVVGAHVFAGSFTPDVLAIAARCFPAMVAGVLIGGAVSKRVDASLFRKALDGALIAVGAMLWL